MRAAVYVNHGRWVVECPADDCRAAIDVSRPLGSGWASCDCGDLSVCYHERIPCDHMILLDWPADLEAIVRILDAREDPCTRNWLPGETVEDLKAENLLHGMRL